MPITGVKTDDGRWVARYVKVARSWKERLFPLPHGTLHEEEALLLSPGGSIHTFAMHQPIDAVFLSGQMKILRVVTRLAPRRVQLAPAKTKHVLQLAAGRAERVPLRLNSYLCVETELEDREALERTVEIVPAIRCSTDLSTLRFSLWFPLGEAPRTGAASSQAAAKAALRARLTRDGS